MTGLCPHTDTAAQLPCGTSGNSTGPTKDSLTAKDTKMPFRGKESQDHLTEALLSEATGAGRQ